MQPQQFFETYKDWAIETQAKSGVPASVTLAQAAIESSWGESTLAKTANNYFGIKTAGLPLWVGDYVLAFDVLPDQKFRKYKTVYDSFIDHADFLRLNNRYKGLFANTDYSDWAHGLENAGYAQAGTYADTIISLVEKYNLQQYDQQGDEEMKTVVNTIIRNRYTGYKIVTVVGLAAAIFFGGRWGYRKYKRNKVKN